MIDTHDGRGGRTAVPQLLLIAVLFLVCRLLVLPFPQPASDVAIYARYAREQQTAASRGVSFYDVHAAALQQPTEKAEDRLVASREENKDVEYPPLALAFMRLPLLWMRQRPADKGLTPAFVEEYRSAYRIGMAVVDGGLFALVVVLAFRLFAHESSRERLGRFLAYLASSMALWHLLYDRLDLLQAALVMLSLTLLFSRLHYAWSFAVLALAVNFKLTPVVLAPVWVVGAWPVHERLALSRPRVWAALAARAGLLLGLTVGCFLPFYLADGSRTLGFLAYHRARGIEFESLYGSLLMALQTLGQPLAVEYSYGSINLHSSLSPVLAAVSPWLTASLLLGATILLLAHCRRLTAGSDRAGPASDTMARSDPSAFVSFTLLFLMLFIVGNKVFSPQYLLWLAPLVVLVPFPRRGRRLFLWGFVLTCVLSTIVCPVLVMDMVEQAAPQDGSALTFREPTIRLAVILGLRNLLFLGLTAGLAVHLFLRALNPRGETTPAG
jgi:hypothetical protein